MDETHKCSECGAKRWSDGGGEWHDTCDCSLDDGEYGYTSPPDSGREDFHSDG